MSLPVFKSVGKDLGETKGLERADCEEIVGRGSKPTASPSSDFSVAESALECEDSDFCFSDEGSHIREQNHAQKGLPIFCQKFILKSVPLVTENDAYHVSYQLTIMLVF